MRGERRQSQEPRVEPQTTKSFGFYCWPGTGTIATASSNLSPPLFPTVRGWKSDGTQEQHPHCRPPTPPHEHEHSTDRSARARRRRWWTENAYQLAARRRRRRHSGGLEEWPRRRRGASRAENRSPPPQESKPSPGSPFLLFFALHSHQLAFSFPPRQLEQVREPPSPSRHRLVVVVPLRYRLPPPAAALEVAEATKQ
jgi:hypothetical protein